MNKQRGFFKKLEQKEQYTQTLNRLTSISKVESPKIVCSLELCSRPVPRDKKKMMCTHAGIAWRLNTNKCAHAYNDRVVSRCSHPNCFNRIQPGAVKLVPWRHWMHATQVHPVTAENQFHCTRLLDVVIVRPQSDDHAALSLRCHGRSWITRLDFMVLHDGPQSSDFLWWLPGGLELLSHDRQFWSQCDRTLKLVPIQDIPASEVCVGICMHACVCVWVCGCGCVCELVDVCVCVCVRACTYPCLYVCACMRACVGVRASTLMTVRVCVCVCFHVCIFVFVWQMSASIVYLRSPTNTYNNMTIGEITQKYTNQVTFFPFAFCIRFFSLFCKTWEFGSFFSKFLEKRPEQSSLKHRNCQLSGGEEESETMPFLWVKKKTIIVMENKTGVDPNLPDSTCHAIQIIIRWIWPKQCISVWLLPMAGNFESRTFKSTCVLLFYSSSASVLLRISLNSG